MKPIIGINMDVRDLDAHQQASIQSNYYDAIQRAGGIPLMIPPMPKSDLKVLVKSLCGLLLTGGLDYSPKNYGQEKSSQDALVHPVRDEFDLRLVRYVLARTQLPILGICAGCQALNVALGGTLIQDIATQVPDSNIKHRQAGKLNRHAVKLVKKSRLARVYQAEQLDSIVSSHHQCVDKPGKGLEVSAQAFDGVIEAIEMSGHPFVIGVQWHPERDYEGNLRLFRSFVEQCRIVGSKK